MQKVEQQSRELKKAKVRVVGSKTQLKEAENFHEVSRFEDLPSFIKDELTSLE